MTTQTLKDIFAPTWTRLITAVSLAVFTHFFILVVQVRQSATADLGAVKHFWLTNFINALPYLETQNTFPEVPDVLQRQLRVGLGRHATVLLFQ